MSKSAVLIGMSKIGDDKYIIGENDWGEPVCVDRDTMLSEFMWIGFSKKNANKLIGKLDKEYKK